MKLKTTLRNAILLALTLTLNVFLTNVAKSQLMDWGVETMIRTRAEECGSPRVGTNVAKYEKTLIKHPVIYQSIIDLNEVTINGKAQTNVVEKHRWGAYSGVGLGCPGFFIFTNALTGTYVQDGLRNKIWTYDTNVIGTGTVPPNHSIGGRTWVNLVAMKVMSESANATLWVKVNNPGTTDYLFGPRYDYNIGQTPYWCQARYRIASNATHQIVCPIMPEIFGQSCWDIRAWDTNSHTWIYPGYLDAGGPEMNPWQQTACSASNTTPNFSVTIPTVHSVTNNTSTARPTQFRMLFEPGTPGNPPGFRSPLGKGVLSYYGPPTPTNGVPGTNMFTGPDIVTPRLIEFTGTPNRIYRSGISTNLVDWQPFFVPVENMEGNYQIRDRAVRPYHIFYKIYPLD